MSAWQFIRCLAAGLSRANLAAVACALLLGVCVLMLAGSQDRAGWHAVAGSLAGLAALFLLAYLLLSSKRVQHWVDTGRWRR